MILGKMILGISKISDPDPQKLELVELSSEDLTEGSKDSKPRPAFTLNFGFRFLNAPEDAEHGERVTSLLEICEKNRPLAALVNLPPSVSENARTPKRVYALLDQFRAKKLCPLYFDFGKLGPPAWSEPGYCVSDPLWHAEKIWSDYWKIHGWHSERWVRLYPSSELKKLKALALVHRPRFIVLAHSQRKRQWEEMRNFV